MSEEKEVALHKTTYKNATVISFDKVSVEVTTLEKDFGLQFKIETEDKSPKSAHKVEGDTVCTILRLSPAALYSLYLAAEEQLKVNKII